MFYFYGLPCIIAVLSVWYIDKWFKEYEKELENGGSYYPEVSNVIERLNFLGGINILYIVAFVPLLNLVFTLKIPIFMWKVLKRRLSEIGYFIGDYFNDDDTDEE